MTMKRTARLREDTPPKGDVWVVLNVRVLNVSIFFLSLAGKDAPAEFDTIHHPVVVDKVRPSMPSSVLWAAARPKTVKRAARAEAATACEAHCSAVSPATSTLRG